LGEGFVAGLERSAFDELAGGTREGSGIALRFYYVHPFLTGFAGEAG
jgi:hypothetical protein